MKKILFALLICLSLGGQALAQLSIRFEGAALFDKSKRPSSSTSGSTLDFGLKSSTGLRIAAAAELKFLGFLYIAPGVTFHRHSESLWIGVKTSEVVRNELTIPVNLGVRVPLGLLALSAEAGPHASYELSNSIKVASRELLGDLINDFKGFDSKKLTYGLNASMAVEFSSFYVRGGVLYPLSDKFDLKEMGQGVSTIYNEIAKTGINSKVLTYFLGAGVRF